MRGPKRTFTHVVTLTCALLLGFIGVMLYVFQLETMGQLLWLLGITAFLWGAVELSLYLRPRPRERDEDEIVVEDQLPVVMGRARPRNFVERFFPGASLASGEYNRESDHAWDENRNLPHLPPHLD